MIDKVRIAGVCRGCGEAFERQVRDGGGWYWRCPKCHLLQPGPAIMRAERAELALLREGNARKHDRATIRRRFGLKPKGAAEHG